MSAETFSPFDCETCRDCRVVSTSARFHREDLIPCPVCGQLRGEDYESFRRERWQKRQPDVTICELDLTAEELATYRRLKGEHPRASKATVLMWIEGQRETSPRQSAPVKRLPAANGGGAETRSKGGPSGINRVSIGLPDVSKSSTKGVTMSLPPSILQEIPEIPPKSLISSFPPTFPRPNAPEGEETGPW